MEDIIIFGASRLGEIAYNILKDRYNICYFSDNDSMKWKTTFCDKKVIKPSKLIDYKEKKIIIASEYYGEISSQLMMLDINNIYVFWYEDVNDRTYRKRYIIEKTLDVNLLNEDYIDKNYKNKYLDNFSLLYNNKKDENSILKDNFYSDSRNVLIIANLFPPMAGSGVQRTLKFVKYLKRFNWNPIVVTSDNIYTNNEKDYSLLKEIDKDIKIIRIKSDIIFSEQLGRESIKEIVNLIYGLVDDDVVMENFLKRIKENNGAKRKYLMEPDRYIGWANTVLKNIEKYIDFKKIDIIYSTSSPYSDHLIGCYLKNKYKIPLVLDYRDAWITDPYKNEMFEEQKQLEYAIERSFLRIADKVIQVTPLAVEDYKSIFKLNNSKITTLTNGYDEDDFIKIKKNEFNSKFLIVYGGTLYKNRYPKNLIIGVNELIEEGYINKNLIEIEFFGKFSYEILNIIKKDDIYNLIKCSDYLEHEECLKKNARGNILLLPIGEEERFKQVYTGKIFEYMRLCIPILALSPKDSVVDRIIKETNTGINTQYDKKEDIKSFILKNYRLWEKNQLYNDYNFSEIKKYDRKNITERLANIFEELYNN